MRYVAALMVLTFALTFPLGQAQTQMHVSLDIGKTSVWLGMPKADAAKKLKDAGYEVENSGNDLLTHCCETEFHTLRFTNDRLSFADVEWYRQGKIDPIDATLAALSALSEKSQQGACSVTHDPVSKPEAQMNRIFITCGGRSVMIAQGLLQGHAILDVSEQIGEFQYGER